MADKNALDSKERNLLREEVDVNETIVKIIGGKRRGSYGLVTKINDYTHTHYKSNGLTCRYSSYFTLTILIDDVKKVIGCNNIRIK